jgi:hypothetical protein
VEPGPPRDDRVPVRLTGERASQVLARVAELSAPYGTAVSADGDTGWVAV